MKSILIVDDENDISEVLGSRFEGKGFTVIIRKSGYEAIETLNTTKVDLVLTDYNMNDGDGVSLAHFCERRNTPCIVMTGHRAEDVKHYLPKNVSVIEKSALETSLDTALLLLSNDSAAPATRSQN